MHAELFDARAMEELVDKAARDLAAATRDSGASAEMQTLVIRTARALRDDLLQMLCRARDALEAERHRLECDSHDIAAARERLRAEQLQVAEQRKRLDDQSLQQFITRPDRTGEPDMKRLLEEKCRLAADCRQLGEERRHMSLVNTDMALADTGIRAERQQLAEEARALSLDRQNLQAEWQRKWLQLTHHETAQRGVAEEMQALVDERRWLDVERCRLAEEANQLSLCSRQLDQDRQCFAQGLQHAFQNSNDLSMARCHLPADELHVPRYLSPPGEWKEGGPFLLGARGQLCPKNCGGRLDQLHEESKVLEFIMN